MIEKAARQRRALPSGANLIHPLRPYAVRSRFPHKNSKVRFRGRVNEAVQKSETREKTASEKKEERRTWDGEALRVLIPCLNDRDEGAALRWPCADRLGIASSSMSQTNKWFGEPDDEIANTPSSP